MMIFEDAGKLFVVTQRATQHVSKTSTVFVVDHSIRDFTNAWNIQDADHMLMLCYSMTLLAALSFKN